MWVDFVVVPAVADTRASGPSARSASTQERGSVAKSAQPGTPAQQLLTARGWLVPVAVSMILAAIVYSFAVSLYPTPPILRDALGYTMTAQRLVERHVFSYGTQPPTVDAPSNALITPGVVLFLGGVYGVSPDRSADATATAVAVQPSVRGVQFLLALVTVGLIAGCAFALGGRRVSYVAGVMAALYLPIGWSTTVALSECLAGTLASTQLLLALVLAGGRSRRATLVAGALGVSSAALALVRPIAVLWIVVPFAFYAARKTYDWVRFARLLVVALVGFVLIMAPWWARNALVLHTFIPLSEGVGNPTFLSTGGYPLSPDEQALFDAADAQGKDAEAEVGFYRLGRWVREEPLGFLGARFSYALDATRLPWMVPRDALWEEIYDAEAPRIAFGPFPLVPSRALVGGMDFTATYQVFLLVAAAVALVFARRAPRLLLVASVPLYFVLMHSFTLFINRYFFPAMPAMIVLAASGVYAVVRSVQKRMAPEAAR